MRDWNFRPDPEHLARMIQVAGAFDREALKRVCEMHETEFAAAYDMETFEVDQPAPDNFYFFKDNGAKVLAVAHLDTVGDHEDRTANFLHTADGEVIYSRALDDRLGAYVILELLPALGIEFDLLLTVGEESGNSTAAFFSPPRDYHWMIEFDRGGTDVVLYQYEDEETMALVRESGARVGDGIFSDICYLEHLECKGFNWGVGYQDYHGPRAHAFLNDTFKMVAHFLKFHEANADEYMPHEDYADPWFARYRRDDPWADEEVIEVTVHTETQIAAHAADTGLTYAEAAAQLDDRDADLLADLADARWPSTPLGTHL